MDTSTPASPPATAPADISESDLARVAGVARDDLKKLREKLARGVDWHGGAGKPVMITPAGVARLQELLSAPPVPAAAPGGAEGLQEAAEAAGRVDRYCTLVVVRIGNPRILWAQKKGASAEAAPLRVMVKESRNFRPGMDLEKCEASSDTPGVYYYHGRLPRSFGRY